MTLLSAVELKDILANRPAAAIAGRMFYATDTQKLYRDTGTAWEEEPITPDATGVTAGSYGDASHIPVVTVAADGLVTGLSVVPAAGGGSGSLPTTATQGDELRTGAGGTPAWQRRLFFATDFGAVFDGVTDDTTAIQAAINAASAAGGGTVELPLGTAVLSMRAAPNANTTVAALYLKNRVRLRGQGMRATVLTLANGSNCTVCTNQASPDGVAANAKFCAVSDLTMNGNGSNQTAGYGIYWQVIGADGTGYTEATNDDDYDSHQLIENVFIHDTYDSGLSGAGQSENRFSNVYCYKCGIAGNADGITIQFDAFYDNCTSAWSGKAGWKVGTGPSVLSNCKAFYNGQTTPSAGYGYDITTGGEGTVLTNCVAQDNAIQGFLLNGCNRVALSSCMADSNSTHSVGTYAGFDLYNCHYCTIDGVAFERKADGATSYQQHAIKVSGGASGNQARITHSAANGATIGSPVVAGSTLTGNRIVINAEEGVDVATVAAGGTYSPDLYEKGGHVALSLGGAATIANPATPAEGNAVAHAGSIIRFSLHNTAGGSAAITWGTLYKGGPTSVAAGAYVAASFLYDGSTFVTI